MVSLDRCNESCNFRHNTSGRIFVPNKIEDENLNGINRTTNLNELKALNNIM